MQLHAWGLGLRMVVVLEQEHLGRCSFKLPELHVESDGTCCARDGCGGTWCAPHALLEAPCRIMGGTHSRCPEAVMGITTGMLVLAVQWAGHVHVTAG